MGEKNVKHLQGFVQFKNQIDFNKLKKLMPKCHLEKCRNIKASIKYCSKEETKCGNRFCFGIDNKELFHKKLSEEEILHDMKMQMFKDIEDDPDGFWKNNLIDF